MNVKRFVEDDMRRAIARVRAELGKDAVILSTRRIDGRTEITAATGYDQHVPPREAANFAAASGDDSRRPGPASPAAESSPSMRDIQAELARLRKLFEGELSQLAWRDMSNRQPNQLALITRLESVGISRDICRKVVDKVLPCQDLELGWRRTLRMLARLARTAEENLINSGGIVALLGPTGVGKTTTAAKLAAHFALRHGRNSVAFVTTDGLRVGGREQLFSYGGILGIPVQVASGTQEMRKILGGLAGRKLVLIDTAGMGQRDLGLSGQLKMLAVKEFNIRPYLVLSAIAQEAVINETLKAFGAANLAGAIITKTDEAANLGAALSGVIRHKVPVVFLGTGQRVPEDLALAKPEFFFNHLNRCHQRGLALSAGDTDTASKERAVHA